MSALILLRHIVKQEKCPAYSVLCDNCGRKRLIYNMRIISSKTHTLEAKLLMIDHVSNKELYFYEESVLGDIVETIQLNDIKS